MERSWIKGHFLKIFYGVEQPQPINMKVAGMKMAKVSVLQIVVREVHEQNLERSLIKQKREKLNHR